MIAGKTFRPFRTEFEQYCSELKSGFRLNIVTSALKCIIRWVIQLNSGAVLLPCTWGNEFKAEVIHVDQPERMRCAELKARLLPTARSMNSLQQWIV